MNKRVLEDIKFNKVSKDLNIPKVDMVAKSIPKEEPIIKPILESNNIQNQNPVRTPIQTPVSGSKYEFLQKKKSIQSYTQRFSQTPQMPGTGKRFNKSILYAFIIALLIGVFYLFSTVLFKAKVVITPKSQSFELKDDIFTSSKKNDIPFEVMIVEDTLSKDVFLTNSKEVTEKAKGEITLFNEYTKTAQKITAGTFLTDEAGKSYKTDTTVTISGFTLNKDQKVVPGQIVAPITSFIAGEAYNGSPTSFYITSFKSSPDKYKKIYGKLKTPLTGGMAGLVYVVDEAEKTVALQNVSLSEERLLRKLNALVPQGYILYPKAVSFSYDVASSEYSKIPNAKLDVKGTLSAILLKEDILFSSIIKKILPDISPKEKIEIIKPDLSVLDFNFVNKDQTISKDTTDFDFKLKGNLTLDWNPNTEELTGLLLGKKKTEVSSIFKTDPGVSSASVSIIPFWSKKLPSVIEKINIVIQK